MTAQKSQLPVIVQWLIVAFCLHHMAATVLVNVPGDTAIGNAHRIWMAPYVRVTSLWQNWSMFQTIPYFASIEPKLVARMGGLHDETLPPVLPGLRPYDASRREAALFLRLMFPGTDYRPYVLAYLTRACAAVEARLGARPEAVALQLDAVRIQPLEDVSRTGQIGKPAPTVSSVMQPCR